jgi:membrane associated rhomboid family serine protease
MIPLRDVIPSRTTPVVTVTILVVNVLAFLYETSMGPAALDEFLMTHGIVPAAFAWSDVLTSMFLHGGWLHLIGNMLSLWIFGDNVEDRLGHGRFIVFYLLCGTLAALAHVWVDPLSLVPTIGASGAIAGVMGGYFVLYPQSRIITLLPIFIFIQIIEVPAVVFLGLWFLLQLVSGVGSQLAAATGEAAGGIALWEHVGGFVVGALLVKLMARPERAGIEWYDTYPR